MPDLRDSAELTAGKAKLSAAGKAVYDKLPAPAQKAVDIGQAVEHRLEAAYAAGQDLAKSVAAELGHGPEHVERVGRILAVADGAARWTANIPVLHHLIEVMAHVGGPVAFIGAKAGYYVPVASLAYVGYHMARAALAGVNPLDLIRSARERVKARKELAGNGH
jgi:hypothetical protein